MPLDRLFHPRAGHSRKVTALSHLEFRVWWTYEMVADDYGVMRRSPVVLQAANDSLARISRRVVDRALDRIVEVGLLVPFGHQDAWYVCQLDWQDFQKVRYPRESHQPSPTPEVLQRCSDNTRALFQQRSGNSPEVLPKDSSRARTREEANGLRLTANGSEGVQGKPEFPVRSLVSDDAAERAGRLVERYSALFSEHRRGAKLRQRPNLDWQDACSLVPLWDDARLDKLAILVLTTDDSWISGTDRGFKIFAMKASWADDRLKEWEEVHAG
jgi:hypothetical protein